TGVQMQWRDADHFCDIAFPVEPDPKAGTSGGVVLFEASTSENNKLSELCTEVTRVATALVGSLPPAP
ncbi:hypothetical protein, partial [Streptomyces roseolus]|uniref:hypothetical protein n=1 Tax=Streptomyces roseolus TaxID=67358 RepID=UPI00365558A2